jgi:hypothetical protein
MHLRNFYGSPLGFEEASTQVTSKAGDKEQVSFASSPLVESICTPFKAKLAKILQAFHLLIRLLHDVILNLDPASPSLVPHGCVYYFPLG